MRGGRGGLSLLSFLALRERPLLAGNLSRFNGIREFTGLNQAAEDQERWNK